jgi:dUTP pyrophosphatase
MTEPVTTIRIQRLAHAGDLPLPAYETPGSAGMDVRAAVDAPLTLAPGAIALVPTGIVIEVPAGFEMQVRPRSGLAARHGIALVNAPGLIDPGYRGEIAVLLLNTDRHQAFAVEPGDRIAQLVLATVAAPAVVEVQELATSERAAGGFGSSGR